MCFQRSCFAPLVTATKQTMLNRISGLWFDVVKTITTRIVSFFGEARNLRGHVEYTQGRGGCVCECCLQLGLLFSCFCLQNNVVVITMLRSLCEQNVSTLMIILLTGTRLSNMIVLLICWLALRKHREGEVGKVCSYLACIDIAVLINLYIYIFLIFHIFNFHFRFQKTLLRMSNDTSK